MIKKTSLFFVCLLFVACFNNKTNRPDTVLSVQKMEEVMLDVNLLEATLNQNLTYTRQAASLALIYKKHNTTKKQYQESFDYYTLHLDSLNKIYELVLVDLSKLQAEIKNKKEPVKDTIHPQQSTKAMTSGETE